MSDADQDRQRKIYKKYLDIAAIAGLACAFLLPFFAQMSIVKAILFGLAALLAIHLFAELLTGDAYNSSAIGSPSSKPPASRQRQPLVYWSAIVSEAAFLAFVLWMIFFSDRV